MASRRMDRPRYHGSLTVLESSTHGPELCGFILESFPPQGRGVPVQGWDWTAVDGAESASGTTWGTWHLTGTFDGEVFTLTEPPGPSVEPDDERSNETEKCRSRVGTETERRLAAVQQEVTAIDVRAVLGGVQYVYTDSGRGVVAAVVWFADEDAIRFAEERWGGLVELRPLLEPVE